ncbi:MAG TPA: cytochrome c oxidase assembly protein [Alphaproteobacteria bacterium]
MNDEDLIRKNQRMGLIIFTVIVGMVGLSFASVPLYRLFCQVTGFGGTPQIGRGAGDIKILDRDITIRFNADVASGMPWTFHPETPQVTLKIGQQGLVSFYAKNNSRQGIEGTAIFNVLPEQAGIYFHKIQCFCFERQVLEAGKDAHMPVVFYIDPAIADDPDLKDIRTLTLSYTFFKADTLEESLKPK